jgi:hypothetical protein
MRLVIIAFLITLSNSAFAEMSNNRLRVLLNICDAAQISSDLGTVKKHCCATPKYKPTRK